MNNNSTSQKITRCAIYTRKSVTEGLEQEFNSLDAQREAAEAFIASQRHEGWVVLPERYDDGGFTGSNAERPALKALMADIEAGRIDCIVVYKVDRLSRSLLDFSAIMGTLAGILGEFRGMSTGLVILLVPIFIFGYLHLPQFADKAALVQDKLALLGDAQLQKQMLVPLTLGEILPVGVMGLFAAVVVIAAVSTDSTYLHSWGSIFIQDVVLPFRKKPLSPRLHMWLLRISIFSVAAFGFIWSMVFPLNEYIYMYFQITGAIFLGGAGASIIGGLYWKRGSAAGAWASMITGSGLAVLGIVLRNLLWPMWLPRLKAAWPELGLWTLLPESFPFNGMQMSFFAAVCAVIAYIVVSLLSKAPPANMDKLLHRGSYAIGASGTPHPSANVTAPARKTLYQRLGISDEFTRGDKIIYFFKIAWVMFFVLAFIIGTTINSFHPISDAMWEKWWGFKVAITIIAGLITVVWFLTGGFRDLTRMIRDLRSMKRDADDDGTVEADDRVQQTAKEQAATETHDSGSKSG